MWIAFTAAVVAQLGPLVIMLVLGRTDDSRIAVVPLFTMPLGLLIGLALLISPNTWRLSAGVLGGTAVSLAAFAIFLFWVATRLA